MMTSPVLAQNRSSRSKPQDSASMTPHPTLTPATVLSPLKGQGRLRGTSHIFRVVLVSAALLFTLTPIRSATAQTTSPTNVPPVIADFNHDGIPDVLVPSPSTPTATLVFGSVPFGTFSGNAKAVTFPSACTAAFTHNLSTAMLLTGDFNGDGLQDIFYLCAGTTAGIMVGNGDGTFTTLSPVAAPASIYSAVTGDFNHDGKLDIALVGTAGTSQTAAVFFYSGNGDGTFATPVVSTFGSTTNFSATQQPSYVSAFDINSDGYPDIVVNSVFNETSQAISVFGNNQDGTFGLSSQAARIPNTTATLGTQPAFRTFSLQAGNIFGTGYPDLVIPNYGTSLGYHILRNTSTATTYSFAADNFVTSNGFSGLQLGHFTGTALSDLAIANGTNITVLANDGTGNFTQSYSSLSTAATTGLFTAADANGDGYTDIYTASASGNSVSVAVNLVSGTATATSQPFTLPLGSAALTATWPGNLNYAGTTLSAPQTVVGTPTTVALTSSLNPAPVGTTVTFTAVAASASATQTLTGSIVFTDGSSVLATVPLNDTAIATFTTSTLTAATHIIQAAYSGDNFYAASTASLSQGITTTGQLTANLLLNPGAELGLVNGAIPYWTPAGPGSPTLDSGTFDNGINPHTGTYDFVGFNGPSDSLSQTVSLLTQSITPAMLDTGTLRAALSFYEQGLNQGTPSDDASVTLTFLDANGATLSSVNSGEIDSHNNVWQNFSNTYAIPTGTRSITYTMNFIRHAGSDLDGFVDDNSLLILAGAPVAAVPNLTWTPPASIPYGTPLSSTQLDAAATNAAGVLIPGVYTYTPAIGAILPVGTQTLSVLFTPTDLTAFTTATITVPLTILPVAPTTTLAITSGTSAVTSVAQGAAITLTATVLSGTLPVNPGQVSFCDASAPHCTDIHLLGTAQLTPTGTATIKFIPTIGTHTYKAVFLGTSTYKTASASAVLTVTGLHPFITTLTESGTPGNYTLTATTSGTGSPNAPTGAVSFLDTTSASAVLATSPVGTSISALTLSAATTDATGAGPLTVFSGDFNSDGKPDLAVLNQLASTVTVLLGKGDGTFTVSANVPVPFGAYFITAADFNNDGTLDLAVDLFVDVSGGPTGSVTIIPGNGDGTFAASLTPISLAGPAAIATGDFNGDGIVDLAVALTDLQNGTAANSSVAILLGNGDGTFNTGSTVPTGAGPQAITVGDFNNDGHLDLATANYVDNTLTILLGNGDGTFTPNNATPSTGSFPRSVRTADFDGDGNLDLVVANAGGTTLSVFLGKGNGTFTPTTGPTTGKTPNAIAIADFNADGRPDLAVTNYGDNTTSIFTGNGDGSFASAITTAIGASPLGLTAADFNGDGIPDLAASSNTAGNATILLTQLTQTTTATATSVSAIGTGTHQIVASYPGDTSYAPSVSAPVALTAVQLIPTLTWAPAVTTIPYGTALGSQQLNALATTLTGATIPGVFAYTPAAGTLLSAGTQTLSVTFTPSSTNYTSTTATRTITVTQATPTIAWATPAPIAQGTALSAAQLNATATGVTGATLSGVFVYTPAAGTVPAAGTQTLAVTFTPTDTADYITTRTTVQLQVLTSILTAITPNTAKVGDPNTTITLTGTGFTTASLAQVNGGRLVTTFVNATTLTAIVPAADFAAVGTLQVAVVNPSTSAVTASLPLSVTAPTPAVTLSGPTTTSPGTQPALALTITNPYPIPLTATFTLTFTSAVTPAVDDPSIQFAAGGRTYAFTVPANSTTVPAIQIQAGTVAGTITIPLALTAAGVNVTPTTVQPVVIVVPGSVPAVSTATLTRAGAQLTVTIHGFSNTREVAQAAFHFVPTTGAVIDTPDVTVPVSTIFSGWFASTPSVTYGSSFTYTQIFTVSDTTANIGSVQVTLTNSVGVSTSYTAQ